MVKEAFATLGIAVRTILRQLGIMAICLRLLVLMIVILKARLYIATIYVSIYTPLILRLLRKNILASLSYIKKKRHVGVFFSLFYLWNLIFYVIVNVALY